MLRHYHDECNPSLISSCFGDTVPCWFFGCPKVLNPSSPADRKDKFLEMMDHVREHITTEDGFDRHSTRDDDHFTIVVLWEDIKDAYRCGEGISFAQLDYLYTEHYRPRADTSITIEDELGIAEPVMRPEMQGTGKRNDLVGSYEKRKEDRERRSHYTGKGKAVEGKGKGVDRGEASSRHPRTDKV